MADAVLEDENNVYYPGLVKRIESGDIQLIDVRGKEEALGQGLIPKSFNLPFGELKDALNLSDDEFKSKYGQCKPSKTDTNIVFHCGIGKRSIKALAVARAEGYSLAKNFPGGYKEWAEETKK
ncbi:thiosulfate:glutathione sulfurtransferase-like [Amphiura filiformis]|uniref:thiosulfate:glutathione sulfurtransferase-like n=1 Tax=Amphiura filiformis TaxID=82378 RepID=UPI003B21FAE8